MFVENYNKPCWIYRQALLEEVVKYKEVLEPANVIPRINQHRHFMGLPPMDDIDHCYTNRDLAWGSENPNNNIGLEENIAIQGIPLGPIPSAAMVQKNLPHLVVDIPDQIAVNPVTSSSPNDTSESSPEGGLIEVKVFSSKKSPITPRGPCTTKDPIDISSQNCVLIHFESTAESRIQSPPPTHVPIRQTSIQANLDDIELCESAMDSPQRTNRGETVLASVNDDDMHNPEEEVLQPIQVSNSTPEISSNLIAKRQKSSSQRLKSQHLSYKMDIAELSSINIDKGTPTTSQKLPLTTPRPNDLMNASSAENSVSIDLSPDSPSSTTENIEPSGRLPSPPVPPDFPSPQHSPYSWRRSFRNQKHTFFRSKRARHSTYHVKYLQTEKDQEMAIGKLWTPVEASSIDYCPSPQTDQGTTKADEDDLDGETKSDT